MSPKKRQKKNTIISANHDITVEDKDILPYNPHEHSFIDNSIIRDQDEEYELSVIMDIIKMQEKEDNERKEKENQEKIEAERLLKLAIEKRDYNIKEILRKLKLLLNTQNSFEKMLVSILEDIMNGVDLHITIHDNDMYSQIRSYLGLDGKKGTIRLSDEVKEYIDGFFICEFK